MTDSYIIGANSNFNIEIKDFTGPLAVLMELTQKKKINIHEISLNIIIKDFLKYLKKNREMLLEELSGILYIAAILLEIKSKSLIPSKNVENNDEENEESLEILKQREEEYKVFRELSGYFSGLIENESIYLVREAPLEDQFFGFFPEIFKSIKIGEIYNIASKLLMTREEKVSIAEFYKEKITKTIFQEIDRIKVILSGRSDITFKELTGSYKDLMDVLICFLSVLELYKNEIIDIEQFELFGEIIIKNMAA